MANYIKKINETTLRLGEVRFSYVSVFQRKKKEDGSDGKYGVCIVWPKTDTALTNAVNAAIDAAKQKGKTDKWGGKIPANARTPVRDGDIDREDDDNFAGCWFFNANAGQQPGIRVLENGQVVEAMDDGDFYSGCYGCATVSFYPYDSNGNKGVAAGLNNVIKTRDGEKLSGGTSAESDFADLASDLLD